MAISFIRIDDRIIHGQVVTRWSMERPCDGILVVNDAAAKNNILKNALKAASTKKTLIYSYDDFLKKISQAVSSDKQYFLITKEPLMLARLLTEAGLKPGLDRINVGPQSAREGTTNINKNCDITPEEIQAFQQIHQQGYEIDFRLVPDSTSVLWSQIKSKFSV